MQEQKTCRDMTLICRFHDGNSRSEREKSKTMVPIWVLLHTRTIMYLRVFIPRQASTRFFSILRPEFLSIFGVESIPDTKIFALCQSIPAYFIYICTFQQPSFQTYFYNFPCLCLCLGWISQSSFPLASGYVTLDLQLRCEGGTRLPKKTSRAGQGVLRVLGVPGATGDDHSGDWTHHG